MEILILLFKFETHIFRIKFLVRFYSPCLAWRSWANGGRTRKRRLCIRFAYLGYKGAPYELASARTSRLPDV